MQVNFSRKLCQEWETHAKIETAVQSHAVVEYYCKT